MGRHCLFAQPCGELVGHPFHQAPGINEHQRGAVLLDQPGDGVNRLAPDFVGCNRPKFLRGNFDRQVYFPGQARVDDQAVGNACGVDVLIPNQETGDFLYWPLGGRKSDADDGTVGQGAQTL